MTVGRVTKRTIGPDGTVAGAYNKNPCLNTTMTCEVEFPDGQLKEHAANVIAKNMLTQIDSDGYSLTMTEGITDYRKDKAMAVPMNDKYLVTASGQKRPRKTAVGWKLLVKWVDGGESWIPLKDMKESHPIETAKFAKAQSLADEPAFAWWVPCTLQKRDITLSKINARIRKTTHKCGIETPTSVENAHKINRKNNNTFWKDALVKKMTEVGVAFEVLEENIKTPVGWSKVTGHLVWDVKMDFTQKNRWVLDGHKTPNPIGLTCAGVMSRDSIRIAFTHAALNGLDVFAADIRNACLQAPSSQKGPEFGIENVGKVALIRQALYGGKSAGKDFSDHLRSCMRHLDFTSCPADPDAWTRPAKRSDGSDHHEHMLLCADNALVVSENAEQMPRNELGQCFTLKEESIGEPKMHLRGSARKVQLNDGVKCWAFSSSQQVQAAVKNVEECLSKQDDVNWVLPGNTTLHLVPTRARCIPRTAANQCCMLHVTDWHAPMDRRARAYGCLFGMLHVVLPSGPA
jgi:hypothetical protein